MLVKEDNTLKLSRKEQIIRTAEQLFKKNGYSGASMRDIAAELGIEAPSLYTHIRSKDELLETICFRIADKFIKAIDEVNDIYFNAEEKLKMAINSHVKIITEDLVGSSVFIHEWRHLTEPSLTRFIEMRKKYESNFRTILQNGEDENLFETSDKKFAVLTILSALNWITEWYKPDGSMSPEQVSERLTEFILNGLKKKE